MIVFSSDSCAPCISLKRYLDHKGADYRVLDIEDKQHAETLMLLTGKLIVPVTVIEGHAPIIGLNYGAIAKALA